MVHVTEEMQKAGLAIPVMIGGATTSKLHTAVKIAPHYTCPVVHVLDASQAPLVAARLLNPATRQNFIDELNREYEKLCLSLEEKREPTVPLAQARRHPVQTDWANYHPVRPAHEGVHTIPRIPVETVRPYINWKFFFAAWKLSGRFAALAAADHCHTCRTTLTESLPAEERDKALEAMNLYADATRLLDRLEAMNTSCCKALYGFFPANSEADTILLPEQNLAIPTLRQQTGKDSRGAYKSLADYLLPASEGRTDYIGAFAVTAGAAEIEPLKQNFEAEGDSYSSMLLQSLADRLAEATAEYLHEKVRRELWGYAPNEAYTIPELFQVKYRGIRPAVGYPSLPDQLLNFSLDTLLDFSRIDIHLTENGAMLPTASVSGLYLAHPAASYFMIGTIDEEQLADYARRRNLSEADARRLLGKNLR
jgi:5-methyltetrahydrofolate--homocysteine methyltransferase